jgi:hypothetical protein
MTKYRKYYREGDTVVKIDPFDTSGTTPWHKMDKWEITETIRLGEHGVYWIRMKDIRNPELVIESQVSGYSIKDKKAYERWLQDCANLRLVDILAQE